MFSAGFAQYLLWRDIGEIGLEREREREREREKQIELCLRNFLNLFSCFWVKSGCE